MNFHLPISGKIPEEHLGVSVLFSPSFSQFSKWYQLPPTDEALTPRAPSPRRSPHEVCPRCRGSCLSLAGIVGSFSFKQAVWPVALELAPPGESFPYPRGPQVVCGKGHSSWGCKSTPASAGRSCQCGQGPEPLPHREESLSGCSSKCCLPRGQHQISPPRQEQLDRQGPHACALPATVNSVPCHPASALAMPNFIC